MSTVERDQTRTDQTLTDQTRTDQTTGRTAALRPPAPNSAPSTTPGSDSEASVPLEPARDFGWLLTMLSAGCALWASWGLFPNDAVGMWAGYWISACTTIAILGAMWLRTTLPMAPAVAVTALAGGTLLLLGAVRDYPTSISATMIAGGAGIVLGAVMQIRHTSAEA